MVVRVSVCVWEGRGSWGGGCGRGQTTRAASYLLVAQGGGGLEGRRGAQAAQRPGLADLGRLQRPAADGAQAAQVREVSGRPDHAEGLPFHRLQEVDRVSEVASAHKALCCCRGSFTLCHDAGFTFTGGFYTVNLCVHVCVR